MKQSIIFFFILLIATSCEKFVDTPGPDSSVDAAKVFQNDNSAVAAVNAILADLGNPYSILQGSRGVSVVNGLFADELTTVSAVPDYIEIYSNGLLSSNTIPANIWSGFYRNIYRANAIIEGASASGSLTMNVKNQIIGEARFLRAFMYFYLVNMFGPVPLVTTTDYEKNRILSRSEESEVYNQMITDLQEAENLLSQGYVNHLGATVTQRYRPNQYAAKALLARTYLYAGAWDNAEKKATEVLNQTSTYQLAQNLDEIFRQPGSKEVLWNFAPPFGAVAAGITSPFTGDGGHYNAAALKAYGLPPQTFAYDLSNTLSDSIVKSFSASDKRRSGWIESLTVAGTTYYFPFKYKTDAFGLSNVQEYAVPIRLAEVYLVRAEARIQLQNIPEGIDDINKIRFRANLDDTTATDKTEAMVILEHEKRLELFTEFGHRWFDLKRWPARNNTAESRAEEVMRVATPLKGGTWSENWLLMPIPQTDIINNPFLQQNEGYL